MSRSGHISRLHVLCAHEPDADPRIGWTSDAARQHGYDTQTIGWIAGRDENDVLDNASHSIRLNHASPAHSSTWLLGKFTGVAGVSTLWALSLLASPIALIWLVGTLFLMPWRIFDYLLERLRWHEQTTRRVERLVLRIRAWVFWRVDGLFKGGIVRLINGLNAYSWYFFTHAGAFARRYARWLESHPDSIPDVIHANDPDALMAAALVKRIHGCRIIYDAHEYGPDAYILHTTPRPAFFIYERLLMRHVDGAVTVSPPIADKFNSEYDGRPEFHTVPNAPPLDAKLAADPQFSLDAMARGRVRILYQGGFAANRGLEQIIESWAAIDDQQAVLFFRGPNNDYREQLIALARETGKLDTSIFFLPSVSENKLTAAACHADIGIIPYLSHIENHEGACPNKLGQYMQAGLAIAAANLPFVKSILDAGECGVIYDDQASSAMSDALSDLVSNPEKVQKMGQSGRKHALKVYNFEAYFPVLDRLYRNEQTVTPAPH